MDKIEDSTYKTDGIDIKRTIIIYDSIEYFVPFFKKKGLLTFPLYKKLSSTALRFIRKIFMTLNLPEGFWYGEWKKKIKSANTIIIFSSKYAKVFPYIKKHHPNIRVILWYWNPVFRSLDPNLIDDSLAEKWSFDKMDCAKFNLNYNTTFYLDNIELPVSKCSSDLFFLGADKGRRSGLDKVKQQLIDLGLLPNFYIVDDKPGKNSKYPPVSYSIYLKMLSESKVIFDYVQQGQSGLTLRAMESIFFKKKLVTNNMSIQYFDFYNKDNIFLWGKDDINDLKEFIEAPYNTIDDKLKRHYDVINWIKRFDSRIAAI
ncbi:MAG: hypothetical protein JKY70_15005 [Mucilaginibacter sp.]|nr:hypothetical protein [Mucilaginibacter sp.]